MGRGVIRQLARLPGLRVTAVSERLLERAWEAISEAGLTAEVVGTAEEAGRVIREGRVAVTPNFSLFLLEHAEVVVDATGDPEVGARIAAATLRGRKTLVTMNVELDATVGPVLAYLFRSANRVYTVGMGDEPAVLCEMVDFARTLGFEVVCAGKGKNNRLDRRATPAAVAAEAARWGMNPRMLTQFVDGTKTMAEMAALANATGLTVDRPGMHGPAVKRTELARVFVPEVEGGILTRSGVVEYAVGDVAPGVFVVVRVPDGPVRRDLEYLRMGSGPYYVLYRPFHLASLEVPVSIARAALYGEVTMQAQGAPRVECVAVAKRDLARGEELDGVGGETVYGLAEDAVRARASRAVPVGVVAGARTRREVRAGQVLTEEDLELDAHSVVVQLRRLQEALVEAGILS
ncbi:MAG: SAF domain-containing protein [Armatimonadota bacterium]|nr:SAF domain-containing protein [Armatimonadota bacterium]